MQLAVFASVALSPGCSSVGLAGEKPAKRKPLKLPRSFSSLAYSPDGKTLVLGGDGKVVWKRESFPRLPYLFGATPDGRAMMYRFGNGDRIEFWTFPPSKTGK